MNRQAVADRIGDEEERALRDHLLAGHPDDDAARDLKENRAVWSRRLYEALELVVPQAEDHAAPLLYEDAGVQPIG